MISNFDGIDDKMMRFSLEELKKKRRKNASNYVTVMEKNAEMANERSRDFFASFNC